ncbi:guanylate kinase [Roseospirillum parvum]|uniref:Guanylate kinase n=1 Tax=Roseospirillum parvum TaxID=83401 RepID=A0A1G8ARZ4_9PROT|nr:guanylate kinase [Roseospirillum parvum]SDH23709.1 guanylate kinase [Roseospirillum parvum]
MSDPLDRRGLMLVLSSPSGAGKTSIARALLAREPALEMSVSVTTRPPRPGEVDGRDYHFIDEAAYQRLVAEDGLLEHARVFDHHYGTPRQPVEAALAAGKDVLFDIDWQGAQQLKGRAEDDLVTVFILPPSADELARRLTTRAQDSAEVIARRMAKAADEMSHWSDYHYIVVNQDLEQSIAEVAAILTAERLRRKRRPGLARFVNTMRQAEE